VGTYRAVMKNDPEQTLIKNISSLVLLFFSITGFQKSHKKTAIKNNILLLTD
jgi:hypothetical protein